MGFSKFEFLTNRTISVHRGQCRRSKRGTLCFGPLESHACKFGCSVQTYTVLAIFQL